MSKHTIAQKERGHLCTDIHLSGVHGSVAICHDSEIIHCDDRRILFGTSFKCGRILISEANFEMPVDWVMVSASVGPWSSLITI